MSAAVTFPNLLIILQEIYALYAEKKGLKAEGSKYTLFSRLKRSAGNLLSSSQVVNSTDEEYSSGQDKSEILDPEEFIFETIGILENYFKALNQDSSFGKRKSNGEEGTDVHSLWEYESNRKIKELMKINSFTNENKHLRLFDLMSEAVKPGEITGECRKKKYFSSFLKKKGRNDDEDQTEADIFIKEYLEITGDMNFNGMPLSLNEKITILNSKTAQLIGLYGTLKKKQEE